jgi:hypothetical protein
MEVGAAPLTAQLGRNRPNPERWFEPGIDGGANLPPLGPGVDPAAAAAALVTFAAAPRIGM